MGDAQGEQRPCRDSAEAGPSRLPARASTPPSRRRRRKAAGLVWTVLAALSALSTAHAQSATPGPRWGQASALFGDYLVVHGGKTNGDVGGGGYTYTSGVNTAELLLLNLNANFSTSSPPWTSLNTSYSSVKSPAVAYHTLSPIMQGSQLLVFGGDVSSTSASTLTGNDSAFFLELPNYNTSAWWAAPVAMNQPQRRIRHSADTDGAGALWIVGGERDDGSMSMFDEMWAMNDTVSSPVFTRETPPNGGLVGNTATLLSDGTLLVLGGRKSSGLQSFYDIAYYSTDSNTWGFTNTVGVNGTIQAFPSPRQGHVAVSLPHRRLLLHGGASLDWSQAMGDTWILDWSKSPPTWSQIATSGAAPSARFGHSAVARGDKVAFAFGWAGNNAADTGLYVFDASSLTNTSAGFWTGGNWITTYIPDSTTRSTQRTGSSGSSSGNGNSSNGGRKGTGQSGSSSDGASSPGSSSTSSTDPFASPTSSGGTDSSDGKSDTTGAKAGAALGALLGVGLIAGAGFMVYRKRHPPLGEYRLNDGSDGAAGGLLRGSNHYYGADDDPYMLEKGREYTGVGPGGIASFQQGTKPLGPRTAPSQPELLSTTMSMGNVGHAMEGSGPHFRERLALITGFGRRDATGGRQQRFDMLADEDDYTHDAFALEEKREPIEDEDEDEEHLSMSRRLREQSYYGQVEQADLDEDYDRSYVGGDLAGRGAGYPQAEYEASPFDEEDGGETTLLANGMRSRDDENNDSHSLTQTIDTGDMTSNTSQSHANSNSTRSGQDSNSSAAAAAAAAAGIVSFSDSNGGPSSYHRPRSNSNGQSPMVRRSPTWWDRFMGQSFLERSASGRLYPGPRAEEPIRDPAEPPALSAIRESPRSTNPSHEEDSPFRDGVFASLSGADEMGRYVDPFAETHSRSMSSLQSARTMRSSVMNMDVAIQRVGTASSRKTHSTARSGSSGSGAFVSRNTSVRSSAGHRHVMDPSETPGSVIFDPNEWNSNDQVPRTVDEEEQEGGSSIEGGVGNTSADITDLNYTPVLNSYSGGRKRSNTNDLATMAMPTAYAPQQNVKRSKTVTSSAKMYGGGGGRAAKMREASDAPSITPSTTKRARQNRQLTTPVSPQPQRIVVAPLQGSVLDRVKAIEKRRNEAGEEILPIPRSPAVEPYSPGSIYSPEMERAHTFVPGRGGRPILTKIATAGESQESYLPLGGEDSVMVTSPVNIRTPTTSTMMKPSNSSNGGKNDNGASKMRYSMGLVPKQQLFVANPDGRQASDDS